MNESCIINNDEYNNKNWDQTVLRIGGKGINDVQHHVQRMADNMQPYTKSRAGIRF